MNANFPTDTNRAVDSKHHVGDQNLENKSYITTADDKKFQFADQKSAINQPTQSTGSHELSSRNAMQENQPTQQVSQSKEIPEALLIEAQKILNENFKNRDFDFEKFAALHNIKIDQNYKPHSDVIKNAFRRMHRVVNELLLNGIVLEAEEGDKLHTNSFNVIASQDIIDADNKQNQSDCTDDNDKAYALYADLCKKIHEKMSQIINEDWDKNLQKGNYAYFDAEGHCLFCDILSLPCIHLESSTKLYKSTFNARHLETYCKKNIILGVKSLPQDTQEHINEFEKLGMCLLSHNKCTEQSNEILNSARFLTSIGMQTPFAVILFFRRDNDITAGGLSDDCSIILLRHANMPERPHIINGKTNNIPQLEIRLTHECFYHESIHNVRRVTGALSRDELIDSKQLSTLLKGRYDILSAIKNQVSFYSLTEYEEFLAEFSARILCILEQGKNPFDYIYDERLWRLYYEFGGPDFIHTIQGKGFQPAGYNKDCNVLSDSKCDWCSGYPSKFDIDISKIKDQQVEVEGLIALGVKSDVKINETTILPPPPLGYCYEVKDQKLKLKDLASGIYYDPTFCSLTNGPLTLMYAEDRSDPNNPKPLQHHFEILPVKTGDANDVISNDITDILETLIINIWDEINKSDEDEEEDISDKKLAHETVDVSESENSSNQVVDDFWTLIESKISQHKDSLEQFLLKDKSDQYSSDFIEAATQWSKLPQELSPDSPQARAAVKNWLMQIVDKIKKSEQEVPSKTGEQPSKDGDNN